jgi:hypothetical protein
MIRAVTEIQRSLAEHMRETAAMAAGLADAIAEGVHPHEAVERCLDIEARAAAMRTVIEQREPETRDAIVGSSERDRTP